MPDRKIDRDLIDFHRVLLPPVLKPYVKQALKYYMLANPKENPYTREAFRAVESVANELHLASEKKDKKTESVVEFSPDGFITANEKLKHIHSVLEELRIEVFGNIAPPFPTIDHALDWIEKEAGKDIKGKKLGELKHLAIGRRSFLFVPGTPLDVLFVNTALFAEWTPFKQDSLIIYILTGIKPLARIYEFKWGSFVELKIFRPLNERELSSLYKKISRATKPPRKRFTEKHTRLYNFFEKHKTPPVGGNWRMKYKKWKRQYPDDEINSPNALRMAYHRLQSYL
jgi:hypothetical protein